MACTPQCWGCPFFIAGSSYSKRRFLIWCIALIKCGDKWIFFYLVPEFFFKFPCLIWYRMADSRTPSSLAMLFTLWHLSNFDCMRSLRSPTILWARPFLASSPKKPDSPCSFLSSDTWRKQEILDLQVIDFQWFRFYLFGFYRTNGYFSPCFLSEKFALLPVLLPFK